MAPHILKVGTRWMRVESNFQENTPSNPADTLVKRSFPRNGIRTLDSPTRSNHYTEISLLLRAYLSTETEKNRTSGNSKVVLGVCRIKRKSSTHS